MRVAELISIETTNGAVRHGIGVAEALAGRGHAVTLLHRHWLGPELPPNAGFEAVEITFRLSRGELRRVRRQLAALGVEVVHTHTSKALTFALMMRLAGGPPVVASAHSQNLQAHWAFADLVIAPTQAVADYHRRVNRVSRTRLVVIPSLIGAQSFSPATSERRAAARARLSLPEDSIVVGQVADVHLDKRPWDLVLAADAARTQVPRLVVALKGSDKVDARAMRRLEAAQRTSGILVAQDVERDDVGAFLAALDIFALTSAREVGPFSVVEAMSAGLPVVSTDVGRARELLGAEAGIVVPPGDRAALASAIARLAGDEPLRRRMGAAGAKRAAALRDDAPAVAAIEAALGKAAARSASRPSLQRLVAPAAAAWLGRNRG